MPYNLKPAINAGRISASEEWEIKYWAQALGCSIVEVIPAVKALFKSTHRTRKNSGKKNS